MFSCNGIEQATQKKEARESSIHAEYSAEGLERVMGIEPTWPAWKAGALPLSYTRNADLDTNPAAKVVN